MLFNQYEKFYNYLQRVNQEEFTIAAESANFVDKTFIKSMWEKFQTNRVEFLVVNKEGIMFDHFYNSMLKNS